MNLSEVSRFEYVEFTHKMWPNGTAAHREGETVVWQDGKTGARIRMPLEILGELEVEKDGFSFVLIEETMMDVVLN